ncbi:MAG: hypothetical protein HYT29_02205 [Parcubacteria group bacterium]|nr:hypothetical protein [Parcubacteria group bacterium]
MWWFVALVIYLLIGFLLSLWLLVPIIIVATGEPIEESPNLWKESPAFGFIVTFFWGIGLFFLFLEGIGATARKQLGKRFDG